MSATRDDDRRGPSFRRPEATNPAPARLTQSGRILPLRKPPTVAPPITGAAPEDADYQELEVELAAEVDPIAVPYEAVHEEAPRRRAWWRRLLG